MQAAEPRTSKHQRVDQVEEGFLDFEVWQRERGSLRWESVSDRPWNPTLRATVGLRDLTRQLKAGMENLAGAHATGAPPPPPPPFIGDLWLVPQTISYGELAAAWTNGTTGELVLSALPPQLLLNGRFRPVRLIGEGTFSQLVDAIDEWRTPPSSYSATNDGKLHVAIKIMKAPYADPDTLRIYSTIGLQEATWIRQLNQADPNDTSHAIRMHSTFRFGGHFCLVLELLGRPLSHAPPPQPLHLLSPVDNPISSPSYPHSSPEHSPSKAASSPVAARTFTLPEIRGIAVQLLTSLSFLRNRRIVHADIKPENIVLVPLPSSVCQNASLHDHSTNYFPIHALPSVKLIDFGNAIPLCLGAEHGKVQSLPYRAPEVLWGEPYDTAIDMWSVGCVLYELVTGGLIFPLSTAGETLEGKDRTSVLEERLKIEMASLLGGEAEAVCDSWTIMERRTKAGKQPVSRRATPTPPSGRANSTDEEDSSPLIDRPHGRDHRTKVLFWDEAVGGRKWQRSSSIGHRGGVQLASTKEGSEPEREKRESKLLSYKKGDRMHVFGRAGDKYWRCWLKGKEGLVPASHLQLLPPFRCLSAESVADEAPLVKLRRMKVKQQEREIRRYQVDLTLKRLTQRMGINDFIFADFLMQFLIYDPNRRYTPQEALCHRFLVPFFPFKGVFPELNAGYKLVPSTDDLREEAAALESAKSELEKQRQELTDAVESRIRADKERLDQVALTLKERQRTIESDSMQIKAEREKLDQLCAELGERKRILDERQQRVNDEALEAKQTMRQVEEEKARLDEARKGIETMREQVEKEQVLTNAARKNLFDEKQRLRESQQELEKQKNAHEEERRVLAEAQSALANQCKELEDMRRSALERTSAERQAIEAIKTKLLGEREFLEKQRKEIGAAWEEIKNERARLADTEKQANESRERGRLEMKKRLKGGIDGQQLLACHQPLHQSEGQTRSPLSSSSPWSSPSYAIAHRLITPSGRLMTTSSSPPASLAASSLHTFLSRTSTPPVSVPSEEDEGVLLIKKEWRQVEPSPVRVTKKRRRNEEDEENEDGQSGEGEDL